MFENIISLSQMYATRNERRRWDCSCFRFHFACDEKLLASPSQTWLRTAFSCPHPCYAAEETGFVNLELVERVKSKIGLSASITSGGDRIRTCACFRTHAFQACALDRSATPPKLDRIISNFRH